MRGVTAATPPAPTSLPVLLNLSQGAVQPLWGFWGGQGDAEGASTVIHRGLQTERQLNAVLGCNCHRAGVTVVYPRQLFGANVLRAGQVPAVGTAV